MSIPVIKDLALNERDYGDLAGLNKDDAREKWGEEQVHIWRRSYDVAPPGGESLKDTAARVLPYYIQEILPRVLRGDNVLVAAHGNSLRALVMVLEHLSPEQIVAARDRDRRAADLPAQRRLRPWRRSAIWRRDFSSSLPGLTRESIGPWRACGDSAWTPGSDPAGDEGEACCVMTSTPRRLGRLPSRAWRVCASGPSDSRSARRPCR